jgi:hypothetical protein
MTSRSTGARVCISTREKPARSVRCRRTGLGAVGALAVFWSLATTGVPLLAASQVLSNGWFVVEVNPTAGGVTSLRRAADPDRVQFIRAREALGAATVRWRVGRETWQAGVLPVLPAGSPIPGMTVTNQFELAGDALAWRILFRNIGSAPVEIGELGLPLLMNTDYEWNHLETFQRRLFKHAFIAGQGSFLYWLPVKGSGSFLVMQPVGETSLEYFTSTGADYAFGRERYSVFVLSKTAAETNPRGSWRQPQTSRVLKPGEEFSCAFAFRWADSYAGVRDLLYRNNGFDIQAVPGLVVPRDLSALIAVRAQQQIRGIEPEFAADTAIKRLGRRGTDTQIYRIRFSRLGENLLTVRGRDGRTVPIEFFVTEPLETLIRKRSAFIVRNQQHRDPARWYNGLFSLWDRRLTPGQNLLGPDNPGGEPLYAVSGSDDPSNGKCLLLAEKNVACPEAAEIEALEYFIQNFVWGKQQRTDQETLYPYGIYGSDSWRQNRFADRDSLEKGISRPGGPSACRMWRTFDYATYFALYYEMYRIARQRPDLVKYLDAAGYLERAYGTAQAYFDVPAHIRMEGGWSFTGWVYWQYTVGNFHEKYLLPLIAALEAEGQQTKADWLRGEWEKKVKYFIYDNPWPFASEMPIDSTAYESTYAAARYALEHGLRPDTNLWHDRNLDKWYSHPAIDPNRHREFLIRQHEANLACRGVLEMNYWSLGSDFRGCGSASYTLSYMSQMGGWAVLDQALRFDPEPAPGLRLGYASLLSSWALLNSGEARSNFGFWTPGAMHDGAMSWGFQPRRVGDEWNPAMRDLPRGAWPVCGEADHGLVAGIEAACTILCEDPVFGLVALGGEVTGQGRRIGVIPRDGVRQRFHALLGSKRLHLALDRDGFCSEKTVAVARDFSRLEFVVENRGGKLHTSCLTAEGLPEGDYQLQFGARTRLVSVSAGRAASFPIEVGDAPQTAVTIGKKSAAKT